MGAGVRDKTPDRSMQFAPYAWWVTAQKDGASALGLQRILHLDQCSMEGPHGPAGSVAGTSPGKSRVGGSFAASWLGNEAKPRRDATTPCSGRGPCGLGRETGSVGAVLEDFESPRNRAERLVEGRFNPPSSPPRQAWRSRHGPAPVAYSDRWRLGPAANVVVFRLLRISDRSPAQETTEFVNRPSGLAHSRRREALPGSAAGQFLRSTSRKCHADPVRRKRPAARCSESPGHQRHPTAATLTGKHPCFP